MIPVSGQSSSRLVKAAGAESCGREKKSKIARGCGEKHSLKGKCTKHVRFGARLEVLMFQNCTRLWRKTHFEVKMCKTRQVRSTFGSSDVGKMHAVVARSAFPSQNVKRTDGLGALFEVRTSKNCTPLRQDAHV